MDRPIREKRAPEITYTPTDSTKIKYTLEERDILRSAYDKHGVTPKKEVIESLVAAIGRSSTYNNIQKWFVNEKYRREREDINHVDAEAAENSSAAVKSSTSVANVSIVPQGSAGKHTSGDRRSAGNTFAPRSLIITLKVTYPVKEKLLTLRIPRRAAIAYRSFLKSNEAARDRLPDQVDSLHPANVALWMNRYPGLINIERARDDECIKVTEWPVSFNHQTSKVARGTERSLAQGRQVVKVNVGVAQIAQGKGFVSSGTRDAMLAECWTEAKAAKAAKVAAKEANPYLEPWARVDPNPESYERES